MNEEKLPNDSPVTEREAAIESGATAPKPSRKKATPPNPPAPRPPQKEAPPPEPSGNQASTDQDVWTNYLLHQAQCMLQTKQAEVAQRQAELAQRQAEAELLRRLIEIAHRPQSVAPDLMPQLEQAQQQIAGLQSANAQLQARWEKAEQEMINATETSSLLRTEDEKLRNDLASEKAARLAEQKQFKEQIEREIKYEVEGFKGKLAGKLKPIFDQKSATDDHPADAELAEFLRGWFQDLGERLADAGITILRRKP